jgi:hypothetical protein
MRSRVRTELRSVESAVLTVRSLMRQNSGCDLGFPELWRVQLQTQCRNTCLADGCRGDFRYALASNATRAAAACGTCLLRNYRRQQVGLQGALPGGQAEVTGSERVPFVAGAADSLKSFSIALVPQFGQAAGSPPRTSNSKSRVHAEQRNSKRGIRRTPAVRNCAVLRVLATAAGNDRRPRPRRRPHRGSV